MEKLLRLNKVNDSNDITKLRALYDQIETNIRSLDVLGIKPEQFGSLLVPVILIKIPSELQIIISRKFDKNTWDFNLLLKTFKEELEARERCAGASLNSSSIYIPANKRNNRGHFGSKNSNDVFSASSLMTVQKQSTQCAYCRQNHAHASCTIVTDVRARKQILQNGGMCFNCLSKNHVMRECRS